MKCKLDVNSYVFRKIEEAVGNVGKIDIHSGVGLVKQNFSAINRDVITSLNAAYKEKVISIVHATDNDLSDEIHVNLSERLYNYYLKKYGDSAEKTTPVSQEKQLSLFETNTSFDIDTVVVGKNGMVTIGGKSIAYKDVGATSLEKLGFSPEQIGEILKKIC